MSRRKKKGAKQNTRFDRLSEARDFNTSEWSSNGMSGDRFDYVLHGTARGGILGIKFNGDATANNRLYNMQGSGSSASASVNDTTTLTSVLGSTTSGKPSAFRIIITGDSSTERYINSLVSLNSAINTRAIYYKNIVSELTSITLFDSVSRTSIVDLYLEQVPKQANLENYDLIDEKIITAQDINITPISFTGLNGDNDGEYLVLTNLNNNHMVSINGDIGVNYTNLVLQNRNGTLGIIGGGTATGVYPYWNDQGTTRTDSYTTIHAVTGRKRLSICSGERQVSYQQNECACLYSNTVTNVTLINITYAADSRVVTGFVKLYKKKSNKSIDPVPMMTVVEYDIAGVDFSAGITISGIEGDRIEGPIKIECDFVGSSNMTFQLNSITSNSNQELQTTTSTTSAAATTPTKLNLCEGSTDVNKSTTWIYPKSGQNRPCLNEQSSGTSQLQKNSQWVDNSVSEFTDMLIQTDSATSVIGKIIVSVPKNTKQATGSFAVTVN